jgi:serine/threonine protein kinase
MSCHRLALIRRSIPRPPSTEYFILMEICDGGSLIQLVRNHMANKTRFSEAQLEKIFSDTIRLA